MSKSLVLLFGFAGLTIAHADPIDCRASVPASNTVVEIADGETLILDDGRTIRLAEILTPWRAPGKGQAMDMRGDMERSLAAAVLGKRVGLRVGERPRDRYGRLVAHVYGPDGWVQEMLVKAGLARAASTGDMRACARTLQAVEADARQGSAGLWRTVFQVQAADQTASLLRLAGSYQVVEGTIEQVAHVRDRVFLNFGAKWREDFTAGLRKEGLALMAASDVLGKLGAGKTVDDLKGSRVRIRGWVETYNGPFMTISHPEQIEVLSIASGSTPLARQSEKPDLFDMETSARF